LGSRHLVSNSGEHSCFDLVPTSPQEGNPDHRDPHTVVVSMLDEFGQLEMVTPAPAQRDARGEAPPSVSPRHTTADFTLFWIRERSKLLRFAQSKIGSELNAEDIVSDAMYQLLKQWSKLTEENESPERLRRYAYGVVKHIIGAHRRRAIRCSPVDDADVVWQAKSGDALTPSRVNHVDISDALSVLPEQLRSALLKYAVGMDSEEISAETGVHASTVRSRVATARKLVRELADSEPSAKSRPFSAAQSTDTNHVAFHSMRDRRHSEPGRRIRQRALRLIITGIFAAALFVRPVESPLPEIVKTITEWVEYFLDPILPDVHQKSDSLGTSSHSVEGPKPADETTGTPKMKTESPTVPQPGDNGPGKHPADVPLEPAKSPVDLHGLPKVVSAAAEVPGKVVRDVNQVVESVQTNVSTAVAETPQVICTGVEEVSRLLANVLTSTEDAGYRGGAEDRCAAR
jgi:RNA polymerase sigma factor (sigma-70 family)